jgi:hypothetical protein
MHKVADSPADLHRLYTAPMGVATFGAFESGGVGGFFISKGNA